MKRFLAATVTAAFLVVGFAPAAVAVTAMTLPSGTGIEAGTLTVVHAGTSVRYLAISIWDGPTQEKVYNVELLGLFSDLPGYWCGSTVCGEYTGYTWNGLTDGESAPWYPAGVVAPAGNPLPVGEYKVIYSMYTNPDYTGFVAAGTLVNLTVTAPVQVSRTISASRLTDPLRLKGKVVSTDLDCKSEVRVKVLKSGTLFKTVTTTTTGAIQPFRVTRGKYTFKLPSTAACSSANKTLTV